MKKSSFYHTLLHSTTPLGGFPSEYRHPLWYGKTRMVSLPDGEKISKICLFVLTWSTNVTDGPTDRQTLHDSKDRAYASHCAVKITIDNCWSSCPSTRVINRGTVVVCHTRDQRRVRILAFVTDDIAEMFNATHNGLPWAATPRNLTFFWKLSSSWCWHLTLWLTVFETFAF